MEAKRRQGRDSSVTRTMLLDAAGELMVEAGFNAVTSRKLAERVGLTHQSVFYYFGSLDDMFIALIQRNSEVFRDQLRKALANGAPLTALWNLSCHRQSVVMEMELKAKAVHNERVRDAMASNLEAYRQIAAEHIAQVLVERGSAQLEEAWGMATVIEALARHLMMDEALGITKGHSEAITLIEKVIAQIEKAPFQW